LLQSPEILRGQKRGLFPTVQACVVFARIWSTFPCCLIIISCQCWLGQLQF
jgi:hypothetical protein